LSGPQKQRLARKVLDGPKTVKLALNMEREAKKLARLLASAKCGIPSQAYKLLLNQPRPLLLFLLAYYPQAKIQGRVKNYLVKAPQIRARLPENELLALGVRPGLKFDKILERIFFDQLDGKIKSSQQLTLELRSIAGVKETPPPPSPPAKAGKAARSKRPGRLANIARAAAKRGKKSR